jgi:hypothetical protein
MLTELMDGHKVELIPPGTRVRHIKHPELTGAIKCWEYHQSGKVSVIPYKVYWDDPVWAATILGCMSIYQHEGSIEVVPA